MLTAFLVALFIGSFVAFGDILIAAPVLGVALLIVAIVRREAEGSPVMALIIAGLGMLIAVGGWWSQHYASTAPYVRSAGVIMRYDEATETQLALEALGNFLVFCIPIAGYGLGAAIRVGARRLRRRRYAC